MGIREAIMMDSALGVLGCEMGRMERGATS